MLGMLCLPVHALITPDSIITGAITLDATGDKVAVQSIAEHTRASFTNDRMYRIRRGNLNTLLSGSTDGVFVEVVYKGLNKSADAGIKIWADIID
jgi:hypothetical protein